MRACGLTLALYKNWTYKCSWSKYGVGSGCRGFRGPRSYSDAYWIPEQPGLQKTLSKNEKQLQALFAFLLWLKQVTMFLFDHLSETFLDHSMQSCNMSASLLVTSGWPYVLYFLYAFALSSSIILHGLFTYDANYLNMNFKVSYFVILVWAFFLTCKNICTWHAPFMFY